MRALASRLLRPLAEPGFRRRLIVAEVVFGAFLLAGGIEVAKDSQGYLQGADFREPLYPLLLDALELLFGGRVLAAALVVQVALGLVACAILVLYLRRALGLPEWLVWVGVVLLLVLPYALPPRVASRVLSLGIAYPLFLLVLRNLLEAMLAGSLPRFAAAAAWTAALVLGRLQFLFVFPLLALCALLWLTDRDSRRRGLLALGLVAAMAAGTGLAERAYRLARQGQFAGTPFVGLQLVAAPLYVAPASLADELPAGQADLFRALHDTAAERGLLAEANPSPGGVSSYAWHYRQIYNDLVWHVIMPEMRRRAGNAGGDDDDDWDAIEGQLVPLALALIRAEPLGFARLYLANYLSGLGLSYFLLLVVITPPLLLRGLRRRGVELAAGLASLTHLSNCALVALVEPLKLRYSFYANGLVLLLLIALLLAVAGHGDGSRGRPAAADR